MSTTLRGIVLFVGISSGCYAKTSPGAHQECQEFSQGNTFHDEDALGTWHVLHYMPYNVTDNSTTLDFNCVVFTPVSDEERKYLQNRIGKFVENLKFENLTLKMQISCPSIEPEPASIQYLEKLEGFGSYKIIQEPPQSAELDLSSFKRYFHRYQMRLKRVENQYLAMMECHAKSVFLLGPKAEGKQVLQDRIKLVDAYWPEIH